MADEGEFPKINGDIYFAQEANLAVVPYSGSIITSLAVTTTTDTVDLSSLTKLSSLVLENIGDNTAYFRFAATALTSDFPIRPGEKIEFVNVLFTRVDAITAASTTTLRVIAKEDAVKAGFSDAYELVTLSATDTTSEDSFSTSGYKNLIIANDGSYTAYLNFGATAALTDMPIEAGETVQIGFTSHQQIAAICDTGETATIKILGVY